MKTILIDTSSLLYAVKNKIDLFIEIKKTADFPVRVAVVEGVMEELKRLAISTAVSRKERRAAVLALALLRAKKVPLLPGKEKGKEEKVDDLLAEHSQKGVLVITQDRELKRRLTAPYLTIRQGKKIMVVQ